MEKNLKEDARIQELFLKGRMDMDYLLNKHKDNYYHIPKIDKTQVISFCVVVIIAAFFFFMFFMLIKNLLLLVDSNKDIEMCNTAYKSLIDINGFCYANDDMDKFNWGHNINCKCFGSDYRLNKDFTIK